MGGSFFPFAAIRGTRERGERKQSRNEARRYSFQSKLGEIKPRFDSPFHFLLSRPRVGRR